MDLGAGRGRGARGLGREPGHPADAGRGAGPDGASEHAARDLGHPRLQCPRPRDLPHHPRDLLVLAGRGDGPLADPHARARRHRRRRGRGHALPDAVLGGRRGRLAAVQPAAERCGARDLRAARRCRDHGLCARPLSRDARPRRADGRRAARRGRLPGDRGGLADRGRSGRPGGRRRALHRASLRPPAAPQRARPPGAQRRGQQRGERAVHGRVRTRHRGAAGGRARRPRDLPRPGAGQRGGRRLHHPAAAGRTGARLPGVAAGPALSGGGAGSRQLRAGRGARGARRQSPVVPRCRPDRGLCTGRADLCGQYPGRASPAAALLPRPGQDLPARPDEPLVGARAHRGEPPGRASRHLSRGPDHRDRRPDEGLRGAGDGRGQGGRQAPARAPRGRAVHAVLPPEGQGAAALVPPHHGPLHGAAPLRRARGTRRAGGAASTSAASSTT